MTHLNKHSIPRIPRDPIGTNNSVDNAVFRTTSATQSLLNIDIREHHTCSLSDFNIYYCKTFSNLSECNIIVRCYSSVWTLFRG